jgi:hypothetical protein
VQVLYSPRGSGALISKGKRRKGSQLQREIICLSSAFWFCLVPQLIGWCLPTLDEGGSSPFSSLIQRLIFSETPSQTHSEVILGQIAH